jgi:hypothetical protein
METSVRKTLRAKNCFGALKIPDGDMLFCLVFSSGDRTPREKVVREQGTGNREQGRIKDIDQEGHAAKMNQSFLYQVLLRRSKILSFSLLYIFSLILVNAVLRALMFVILHCVYTFFLKRVHL